MDTSYKFYDANGKTWIWNKEEERVFCLEAELELIAENGDNQENGEYARTLEDAIKILNDDGYMDKE